LKTPPDAPYHIAVAHPALLAESDAASIIVTSLILIGLLFAGFYAISRLRRWLNEDDDAPSAKIGFTLGDLRELHRRGEMTTEEYEKAKNQMLAAGKSMTKGIDPLARPNSSTSNRTPHARP
jgi:hypothetical protein